MNTKFKSLSAFVLSLVMIVATIAPPIQAQGEQNHIYLPVLQGSPASEEEPVEEDEDQGNPLDVQLAADALSLAGVSSNTFNPVGAALQFTLSGAEFYPDPDEIDLRINDSSVASADLTIDSQTLTVSPTLSEGRNEITLGAVDTIGRPIYFTTTLWAGTSTLDVELVNKDGLPFTEPATVVAKLVEDQTVFAEASTTTGAVQFQNIPDRTILLQATTSNNHLGIIGVFGSVGSVQIMLREFDAPSPIANNDFSQNTDGWTVGTEPVTIIPHVEGWPEPTEEPTTAQSSGRANPPSQAVAEPPRSSTNGTEPAAGLITDNDLELSTSGEGERSISRTFDTTSGTTAVRIRYRFVTSEVPGGYFGSEYNDYFRVSIRSQRGGGNASESNSMNGLGLGAFDYASGATAWRDVTLSVDENGDTIQVDVGVANVSDDLLDSQVIIDFVEEIKDQIRPALAWNNTQGGMDLRYQVVDGELQEDATIEVYWANGPGYANRIGAPIFSHNVPAGTPEGSHGPVHINGNLLANDPAGVTHLIAASSEAHVAALPDVVVNGGANANMAVVWPQTIDIIKDGLRAAGQATATINSTARTPEDQARAMFQNLVRPGADGQLTQEDIEHNIDVQQNGDGTWSGYAAPGDAVIDRFADEVNGMTPEEIQTNETQIRDAMEDEINNQEAQGRRVSRHMADPATISVVDVGAGVFNANNRDLFVNSVRPRVVTFLDERSSNGCYHLEVQ